MRDMWRWRALGGWKEPTSAKKPSDANVESSGSSSSSSIVDSRPRKRRRHSSTTHEDLKKELHVEGMDNEESEDEKLMEQEQRKRRWPDEDRPRCDRATTPCREKEDSSFAEGFDEWAEKGDDDESAAAGEGGGDGAAQAEAEAARCAAAEAEAEVEAVAAEKKRGRLEAAQQQLVQVRLVAGTE